MTATPRHYHVFLDTGPLRGKDFLESGVKDALSSKKTDQIVTIDYLLPEVVRDEWVQHYLKRAEFQLAKITTAQSTFDQMEVTNYTLKAPDTDQIQKMGESYLDKLGFKIVDTPYNNIDWPILTSRAVKHQPPFEPWHDDGTTSDKGFKDSIIAQTVMDYSDSLDGDDDVVVFIGRDKLLLDYLKELIPGDSLLTFETVTMFQTQVALLADKLSVEYASDASKMFYTPGVKSSLLIAQGLDTKMLEFYAEHFPVASTGAEYVDQLTSDSLILSLVTRKLTGPNTTVSFGDFNSNVGETEFVGRKNNKLHWRTDISYLQDYLVTDQTANGVLINSPANVTHVVHFDVDWETALENHKLVKPRIISMRATYDTKHSSSIFSYSPGSELVRATSLPSSGVQSFSYSGSSPVNTDISALTPGNLDIGSYSPSQLKKAPNVSKGSSLDDALRLLSGNGPQKHFWEDKENGDKVI